jgi:hypothetical protein
MRSILNSLLIGMVYMTAMSSASAATPASPAPDVDRAISSMVRNGLIRRVDLDTGKIYVAEPVWRGFDIEDKQRIARVISQYRKIHKGLPQVYLVDGKSGKELANVGAITGVHITP